MSKHSMALVLAACGLVAACGKGGAHGGGAAGAAARGDPGCGAYHAGTGGVIRTFCGGTAVARLKLNGQMHELKGGTCESAPMFNLNIGVVAGPGGPAPMPDYFGVVKIGQGTSLGGGDVVTLRLDGKAYMFPNKSGEVGAKGGHIRAEGKEVGSNAPALIDTDFTC